MGQSQFSLPFGIRFGQHNNNMSTNPGDQKMVQKFMRKGGDGGDADETTCASGENPSESGTRHGGNSRSVCIIEGPLNGAVGTDVDSMDAPEFTRMKVYRGTRPGKKKKHKWRLYNVEMCIYRSQENSANEDGDESSEEQCVLARQKRARDPHTKEKEPPDSSQKRTRMVPTQGKKPRDSVEKRPRVHHNNERESWDTVEVSSDISQSFYHSKRPENKERNPKGRKRYTPNKYGRTLESERDANDSQKSYRKEEDPLRRHYKRTLKRHFSEDESSVVDHSDDDCSMSEGSESVGRNKCQSVRDVCLKKKYPGSKPSARREQRSDGQCVQFAAPEWNNSGYSSWHDLNKSHSGSLERDRPGARRQGGHGQKSMVFQPSPKSLPHCFHNKHGPRLRRQRSLDTSYWEEDLLIDNLWGSMSCTSINPSDSESQTETGTESEELMNKNLP